MRRALWVLAAVAACAHEPAGPFPQLEKLQLGEAPRGNVVVAAEPDDADVSVDGVLRGMARDFDGVHGALELSPGPHALAVTKAGYAGYTVTVYAGRDGQQKLKVEMEKL